MFTNKNMQRSWRCCLGAHTLLAILIAATLRPSFAGNASKPGFVSAEQAVEALYKAAVTDNEAMMSRRIGRLTSSDDMIQDKADRQLFIKKYSEMHRLVKESDGTTVLYIGAENWPFPVPLVSKDGKWQFDVDAGEQEMLFRRVGEDEMTVIETCRTIAHGGKIDDPAIDEFAQKLVGSANAPAEAFHGYYFRLLKKANGTAVVAYPSEYGSTGVMTFAMIQGGPVYEEDLGPNSATVAKSLKMWTPNSKWHMVP